MSGEANTTQAALVKHKCLDCGYTASCQSNLSIHRRVHSGERPFDCHTCDSTFTQEEHRDVHIRRVHLKSEQVTCSWSGCDKTFTNDSYKRRHVAAVHLKTRFACHVAGCRFTSGWKYQFKRHTKAVHEKEKPFVCSVAECSYRASWKFKLSSHQQAVHERRRIACSYDGCDFHTSWPQYIKPHVESVHLNIVRFTCHVCGKAVYHKTHFQSHQQKHAKQGHPVAECASCQESLVKGVKRSTLVTQEEQPSTSSEGINDLLTKVHVDMHLLSFREQ